MSKFQTFRTIPSARPSRSHGGQDSLVGQTIIRMICEKNGVLKINNTDWMRFASPPLRSMKDYFNRFPHIFSYEHDSVDATCITVRMNVVLDMCSDHRNGGCQRLDCGELHCCKYFLFDKCKYKQKCKYGHNLKDSHNQQLLSKFFLDELSPGDVGKLLRSECSQQTIPTVCKFYNNEGGCKTGVKGEKCRHMHICLHYLLDDCKFGRNCKRSHNIYDQQPKQILVKNGVNVNRSPKEVLQELRAAMEQNDSDSEIESLVDSLEATLGAVGSAAGARRRTSSSDSTSSLMRDSTEICTFYLRGKCKYDRTCANNHPKLGLPYQWQYEVEGEWKDFEKNTNDEIELKFCDPNMNECITVDHNILRVIRIHFDQMKCLVSGESGNVRRLSTKSSQGCSADYLYLTRWHWYWKNKDGNWIEFGKDNNRSTTSDELEEEFSSNPNHHLSYTAGPGLEYVADLQKMKRINKRSGSISDIRRRPDMFDSETKQPVCKELDSEKDLCRGVIMFTVERGQGEFESVEKLFKASLPNIPLKSVKRIKNAELWDRFSRKKMWMEKKLKPGDKLNVRQLFHGTKGIYIDAICQQGFDWRIAGLSAGTRFGKGSYFAKNASYSYKYTDSKKLFVVQVLVGEYTRGESSMVRPPCKDSLQPFGELYDSVVDNLIDPNIFVVFSDGQAYPEYLIEF